ncbi:MAG: glycerol-3-phosphate 1-O-acyltransferase PlsY [Rhodospirillales bacterium]|nr:glycerol-3-phosphate 1-O-acyltransferase PlsY [Rhodospirillales bacterium]MCB9964702.1 glycerol-3-phosphate 1-O-acyltransferase PlsY [Rhodospirillales bacterium]
MDYFFILVLVGGYLIGSIPFGLLLTKAAGLGDIRTIGSGNIGATNVLRTGNKKLALLTLLLDGGKGAVAILLLLGSMPQPLTDQFMLDANAPYVFALSVGLAAILGHCFPLWLRFKGGKGVATTLGVLLSAVPLTGVIACAVWLLSAFLSRFSSLSALLATLSAPLSAYFLYGPAAAALCALIALLVWGKHHQNIRRLLKGEEPRIGRKS